MTIKLTNNYHNTVARLQYPATPAAVRRAYRGLCGASDCTCGGVRGPITDDDGNRYVAVVVSRSQGVLEIERV